jgi:hypothetical protein
MEIINKIIVFFIINKYKVVYNININDKKIIWD